jgi:hypothetical protein
MNPGTKFLFMAENLNTSLRQSHPLLPIKGHFERVAQTKKMHPDELPLEKFFYGPC